MRFTLCTSTIEGSTQNCVYPHKKIITDENSLAEATRYDHVTAEYRNSYRSSDNFIQSDCIPMDCDNDNSEDEKAWVTPLEVSLAFPDVSFAVVYSRNNMKAKGTKVARPKFHVYFPIQPCTNVKEYTDLKKQIAAHFKHFDENALDSARFLFGTDKPKVELWEGSRTVTEFLYEDAFAAWEKSLEEVPEGKRNSTMSHFAGRILKRFGNTEKAYELFLKEAEKCTPPLPEEELKTIWHSAVKFGEKVKNQEGYIPPEEYNSEYKLKPLDYSDVGQATIMAKEYVNMLRYSPATDYLVYNGSYWEESRPKSQAVAQELTYRQLEEAEVEMKKVMQEMMGNGAWEVLVAVGPKKAPQSMNEKQLNSFKKYQEAVVYRNYAIKRRDSKYITSALKEVRPMLEIEQRILDTDEYLLNTPTFTFDLQIGLNGAREHNPMHLITKQTAVDPSEDGRDLWQEALNTIFEKDTSLIQYVQEVTGLAAIGKVYEESLIISYGEGRNGKSTFWNVISRVLGSYSGNISADVLTVGCKRNVKPELAEAKGKRLLIAAELEEGMRLNTSNVKQLCSTDEIYAEKKYKDPFSYVPTHTLVLYTNHLPKVGAIDAGTWRRLVVIPFGAKIEGSADVKNFADYLFENAAGAILSWIIEGARLVAEHDMKITKPEKVRVAIGQYRESNNWFGHFLEDCCEIAPDKMEKSGELYNEYRSFCLQNGEYVRGSADFYKALESNGYAKIRTNKGRFIKGLCLKSEFE